MKIREALVTMSPSLSLQRSAADEIARLDAQVHGLKAALETVMHHLDAKNYDHAAQYCRAVLDIYNRIYNR